MVGGRGQGHQAPKSIILSTAFGSTRVLLVFSHEQGVTGTLIPAPAPRWFFAARFMFLENPNILREESEATEPS
jgi:hypothetical protein